MKGFRGTFWCMMKLELVKLLGEGGTLESALVISYCHLVFCACFDIVSI